MESEDSARRHLQEGSDVHTTIACPLTKQHTKFSPDKPKLGSGGRINTTNMKNCNRGATVDNTSRRQAELSAKASKSQTLH
jgi:hypothetical protein